MTPGARRRLRAYQNPLAVQGSAPEGGRGAEAA